MAVSTLSNVSASATSVTVLAANNNRVSAQIINDSSATLYLKEGSTASTTSFSDVVRPGAQWNLDVRNGVYKGTIDGIWTSATGSARATERTVA